MQVLIIDDDKDTANFFRLVLELVGFECEIVNSAKHALARLAASQPDLILLDMRLGLEIGGEDILYQIRSNPRLDRTRVIIITAYPTMAEPVSNLADLILLKPVDVEQLRTLTSRLMLRNTGTKRIEFRDPVTDLYNREFFVTRIEHAFERFRRFKDFMFALLVYEIQASPVSADAPALEDYDPLLRFVSERLRRCFRPTDTIARLSGEQFASLHEDLKQPGDIHILQKRLRERLTDPYEIDNHQYSLHFSTGAVLNSPKFATSQEMLERAVQAMTQARERGVDELEIVQLDD
jgi:diguanylate cyclase (GGDEF)-like protein